MFLLFVQNKFVYSLYRISFIVTIKAIIFLVVDSGAKVGLENNKIDTIVCNPLCHPSITIYERNSYQKLSKGVYKN